MPKRRSNASAVAGLSLMSTPRNRTPRGVKRLASWDRNGASARHGVHQDPQKFSTTTRPRYWARVNLLPDTRVPVTRGTAGPEAVPYTVVPGLPETKLCPLPPGPLCPIAAARAAVQAAARAEVGARGRTGAGREGMPACRLRNRGGRDRMISYKR